MKSRLAIGIRERVVISVKGIQQNLDKLPYNPGGLPWLNVEIRVYAGAFEGGVADLLSLGHVQEFYSELQILYTSLQGNARLGTIEEKFNVDLKNTGLGHITATFDVSDGIADLKFAADFDQSFLPQLMDQVKRVVAAYDEFKLE